MFITRHQFSGFREEDSQLHWIAFIDQLVILDDGAAENCWCFFCNYYIQIQFKTNCGYPKMQFILLYQTKMPIPSMSDFLFDTKIHILQRQCEEQPEVHNSPSSLKYCLVCGRKWHICPTKDQLHTGTAILTGYRLFISNILNMYSSLWSIFICSALLHPTASRQLERGNGAEPASSLARAAACLCVLSLLVCVFPERVLQSQVRHATLQPSGPDGSRRNSGFRAGRRLLHWS